MDWAFVSLVQRGISVNVNEEITLFIQAAFTGMLLFAFYDILRIFRRVCSHGIVWVSIEDVIYWIFCGVFIFGVILRENSGKIRSFFVVGVVFGAALYYLGLSRYLVSAFSFVLQKILYVVLKVVKGVCAPIRRMVIFCSNRIKSITKKCDKNIKK